MKLCGYDWPHGGRKQVVYVDDQGHVIELWSIVDRAEKTRQIIEEGIVSAADEDFDRLAAW